MSACIVCERGSTTEEETNNPSSWLGCSRNIGCDIETILCPQHSNCALKRLPEGLNSGSFDQPK